MQKKFSHKITSPDSQIHFKGGLPVLFSFFIQIIFNRQQLPCLGDIGKIIYQGSATYSLPTIGTESDL